MSNSRAASSMGATRPAGASTSAAARKTYFEQQRELLMGEIAMSFEQVLANINKLNRSLEAVVTVGNEFSAVEALWSQFESVMAKEPESTTTGEGDEQEGQLEDGQEHEHEQQEDDHDDHEQHDDDDDEAAAQFHDEEAAAPSGGRGRSRGDGMDFDY
ncbi:Dolichyl-diphosphooligosaccharide-protein glycosyltransferase subunit dad1 [Sporothrix stenoceras]|uniref:DASH complex subunit DAD1 n=1 Tax=Sporothrix stenoceras TaxID=5173 RepID=A0ABR3ZM56_9PEZI